MLAERLRRFIYLRKERSLTITASVSAANRPAAELFRSLHRRSHVHDRRTNFPPGPRLSGSSGAAAPGRDAGDGGVCARDELSDHRPGVGLFLLPDRADARRQARVRAWLGLWLLDRLVRAGGAGER